MLSKTYTKPNITNRNKHEITLIKTYGSSRLYVSDEQRLYDAACVGDIAKLNELFKRAWYDEIDPAIDDLELTEYKFYLADGVHGIYPVTTRGSGDGLEVVVQLDFINRSLSMGTVRICFLPTLFLEYDWRDEFVKLVETWLSIVNAEWLDRREIWLNCTVNR